MATEWKEVGSVTVESIQEALKKQQAQQKRLMTRTMLAILIVLWSLPMIFVTYYDIYITGSQMFGYIMVWFVLMLWLATHTVQSWRKS